MIQLGSDECLREVAGVDGEEGIDLRNISKALHGEEGTCVGGSEKVNEFRFGCVLPEVSLGHLLRLPVGCVDLAPEGKSRARDTDLGGIEAQITARAVSEEAIPVFMSQVFAELRL